MSDFDDESCVCLLHELPADRAHLAMWTRVLLRAVHDPSSASQWPQVRCLSRCGLAAGGRAREPRWRPAALAKHAAVPDGAGAGGQRLRER
eukprot:scaffold112738_cov47-Phaeocystis_antarctica.AAC.1